MTNAEKLAKNHICCPSHCCQIHGCKYGMDDCPVETKKITGMTGCCEQCGLEQSGYYGDDSSYINSLELENNELRKEVERLKKEIDK